MRIAVDCRVLSTEAADRGMGRYTQHQLREVLRIDTENEYILVCRPEIKASRILPEIRSAPNTRISRLKLPGFGNGENPDLPENVLRFSAEFQQYLYEQEIDLYHSTTPFIQHVMPHFDVCPMVATLYDLIPLIFPRKYLLPDPWLHRLYKRALTFIQNAERLISISNSSRMDAYHYLGYPADRIDMAYPIITPDFRIWDAAEVTNALQDLRHRIGLSGNFILSVTGIHYSKNAAILLESYGRLSDALRRDYPLLIVLPSEGAYSTFVSSFGTPQDVILTQSVSARELIALYNAAKLVIHPSRYEGFGYPVAEAMACGAPVITTTTASLPEVGGKAAILVDPDDIQGFADAISELIENPDPRNEMRHLGLKHVQRFNASQLGENTLKSYHLTLESSGGRKTPEQPRIALWSSFPPLECGVGDYSAELVKQLDEFSDIEVFVDDGFLPPIEYLSRYQIQHHTAFLRRDEQQPFDIVLYQMGATHKQFFMYDMIRKRPGIVVLHDLIMGGGFYGLHLDNLNGLKKNLLAAEGKEVVHEFDRILALEENSRFETLERFFEKHYILNWVIESSLAQIVHMDSLKRDLIERYENANAYTVHMGVSDPWYGMPHRSPQNIRVKYNIDRSSFVIGVFGIVHPVKRIETCLLAFAELLNTHPNSILIVAGRHHDATYSEKLKSMADKLNLSQRMLLTDYLPRPDFDNLILASDVIVNLRDPVRKGVSAVILRAIAAGKPVLISDISEWQEFPKDVCMRIPHDSNEVNVLVEHLRGLSDDDRLRADISERARAYFVLRGTLRGMAQQYCRIIETVIREFQRNGETRKSEREP